MYWAGAWSCSWSNCTQLQCGFTEGGSNGSGGGNIGYVPIDSIGLVLVVPLHVLGQMIAAHELLLADETLELLLARVGALVPRQLVGAGEALVTVLPLADEGTLAGVHALMRLQVAALEVVLATVRETALVDATACGRRLSGCDAFVVVVVATGGSR